MKKLVLFLAIIVFSANLPFASAAENPPNLPRAAAFILTDAASGKALYEHNADERLAPASLTKMMLLLLVAEELAAGRLFLTDEVITSPHAADTHGATIWLNAGESMSVEDLLKAVVIASANDAAVALAEHLVRGSEGDYASLANRRAHVLGMTGTNFANATGLDNPNHYSTARDMAILAGAVMREDNYRHLSGFMLTRLCSVRTGTARESQLLNTNKLISYYDGIEGIKTGTTDAAGFCLAAAAARGELRLISVVLGCGSEEARLELSEELLDRGFAGYERHVLNPPAHEDKFAQLVLPVLRGVQKEVSLVPQIAPSLVIPKGRGGDIKYEVYLPDEITAPIAQWQPVGTITATLDGQVLYEGYVLAAESVQRLTFMKTLGYLARSFFGL